MPFISLRRATVALALLAAASCTVKDNQAPPLTGPSGLALTLALNAIPDSISQDGGSQSSVKVTAIGPDGRPLASVPLRMDMMVGGVPQDYGTLSARSIVTNGDGVATVVYTAPPSPVNGVFGSCNGLPGNCVSIIATATSTNFATANPEQVLIRLVPTGVILPPADAPVAVARVTSGAATTNTAVLFDGSGSCGGPLVSGACPTTASAISSYAWSFGDGSTGSGVSPTHTYTTANTYTVTLTVTNARGVSANTTLSVGVSASAAPTASFVFSPAAPTVGQDVVFNADASRAAAGRTIAQYNWIFGDGATKSGSLVTHDFGIAGSYNVTLSVIDDAGQKTTTSSTVAVAGASGGGTSATTASFVASPTAPVVGQVVFFNASGSTAASGRTLTKYAWDFGDGTNFTGTTASATNTFKTAGTFTVALVVTDDTGQTAKFTNTVIVAGAGATAPTAAFTSSPTAPVVNQQVVFDASTSSAAQGLTITDYAWVFGDGTPAIHTTNKTIAHSYAFANTFVVSLTVTDNVGNTKASSGNVSVAVGALPNADFTFTPAVGVAGQAVSFTSTSTFSAPATSIVSYTWNFGDGSALDNTTGANPPHTYLAGTYSVTLTITDNLGRTGTVSKTLVVQ